VNKPLNALYEELDFQSGSLLPTAEEPTPGMGDDDWLEKGEWLAAGKRAGAERVFFVENNPVAVFAECGSDGVEEKAKAFNRIWSLGRPRLLFLASPGEIAVLDLAQKPFNTAEPIKPNEFKALATLNTVAKAAEELQQFHRDNIESGKVFGDKRFGDLKNRADKALIRDLKTVRRELIQVGLSGQNLRHAHALIGRSIFIRYLEDRGILTKDYFLEVANRDEWAKLLETSPSKPGLIWPDDRTFYPRALADKDFTYALFKSLGQDFNGDMFPGVEDEEQAVTPEHLKLIQGLLYGDIGVQRKLFFYSYRFDIVPLDLISSIYEEFYDPSAIDEEKKKKARLDGAYYTPPVLAEFALSRTLTSEELQKKPRVLDPACGSGTFLVESFRRIVRYEWHRNKKRLTFDMLKQILRDQIAGIEVNEEAARITAFSLYLAMLHYLEPPAITGQLRYGNRLPNLLVCSGESQNHYHSIWAGNAFDTDAINASPILSARFGNQCADVVVGNPPWGAPGSKADSTTRNREKKMLEWRRTNDKPIAGKDASQAFLWRTLDFLREGGRAGMLISTGALFNHGPTTKFFREQWMTRVKINEVFNFAHVRKFFFKDGASPFALICFQNERQRDFPVKYWSAKQVMASRQTQAIFFSKDDIHTLRDECLASSELWKRYLFGRLADTDFLKQLQSRTPLKDVVDRTRSGQGYKLSPPEEFADKLADLDSLHIKSFSKYNGLRFNSPPGKVHRLGVNEAYRGKRLLVQQGISEEDEPKGHIVARYESKDFCFTNSIYGIRLKTEEEWRYLTILGVLWSALARYYFFLTSSTWGVWHHQIHLNELLDLPVVLDESNPSTDRIVAIVDKLRNFHPLKYDVLHPDGPTEAQIENQRRKWEEELDEAVLELYGLNQEQKDLIRDCCEVTLPFFYKPFDSLGADSAIRNTDLSWMEEYTSIFARRWNAYLDDGIEMRATIHVGAHDNMVAVEFFPADQSDPWDLTPKTDSWKKVLDQIAQVLPQPMGTLRIVVDGVIHAVTDDAVIVMKRNERRFWTRSLAREDAESTLCKRMLKPKTEGRGQD
jgi:type I restriction-modification system DNA methylase subunit